MDSKENIPRSGNLKARRIYLILDGLHNGLNHDQIQSRLDGSKNEFFSDFRCECSVGNVKRVIGQLPFKKYHISDVVEIPQNSYKDRVQKHDLEIITSDQDVGVIGIQIKSSRFYLSEFYQHLDPNLDTAKKIAKQKKLIILNGALDDFTIERNFLSQYESICRYFKSKSSN